MESKSELSRDEEVEVLEGAAAIAKHLFGNSNPRSIRRVYSLSEARCIPTFKAGALIFGRRSTLDEWVEAQERTIAQPFATGGGGADMTVYKRKDSGWQVDAVIDDKRVRKSFKTRGEAKAYEDELRHQAKPGTYLAEAEKFSVAELADDFIKATWERHEKGKRMGFELAKQRAAHVKNYVKGGVEFRPGPRRGKATFGKGIGSKKVARLREEHVESWLDEAGKFTASKAQLRALRQTLIGILDLALRRKLVHRNVARAVPIYEARNAGAQAKITPPPVPLVQAMVAPNAKLRLEILFAATTALRAGEQWALRWRHIDFDAGKVLVRTSVSPRLVESGEGPKTEAGNRDVPISEALMKVLTEWRKESKFAGDDDLVFPSKRGGFRCHTNHLKRHFRPSVVAAMERIGGIALPRNMRWHDLRHFGISQWIAAGAAPKAVQTWAGHTSITFTMDRYGHLYPDDRHSELIDAVGSGLVSAAGG